MADLVICEKNGIAILRPFSRYTSYRENPVVFEYAVGGAKQARPTHRSASAIARAARSELAAAEVALGSNLVRLSSPFQTAELAAWAILTRSIYRGLILTMPDKLLACNQIGESCVEGEGRNFDWHRKA